MTNSSMAPLLGPEFNDFLYAPVNDGHNGALLSVLSALARLDLDPWQETASLARLPREMATERLTLLIAKLPQASLSCPDLSTAAARLIALLPLRTGSAAPSRKTAPETNTALYSRTFIYAAFMVLAIGVLSILSSINSTDRIATATSPAAATQGISNIPAPPTDR